MFSSAHFAQLADGTSELLHGHNFSVRLELESAVDELGYVIDFAVLKPEIRRVTGELNQKTLLAGLSPRVRIEADQEQTSVYTDGLHYSFPSKAVVILPVRNTTCEDLAAYIGERLAPHLLSDRIEVTVEECSGQGATWVRRLSRRP